VREAVSEAVINEFWAWFCAHCDYPVGESTPDQVETGLDEWMNRLGIPDWEVGPAGEGERFLSISPCGDPEMYPETKRIVALAPSMPGWNFLPARPKKDWDGVLLWSIRGQIDVNPWKVVCFEYPDGMYELAFLTETLPQLPSNEQFSLIEFVVASEIGEDALITRICTISFEATPTAEMTEGAISVRDLPKAVL
jgi:hypothetical protein